jgi:hypothetical protein
MAAIWFYADSVPLKSELKTPVAVYAELASSLLEQLVIIDPSYPVFSWAL